MLVAGSRRLSRDARLGAGALVLGAAVLAAPPLAAQGVVWSAGCGFPQTAPDSVTALEYLVIERAGAPLGRAAARTGRLSRAERRRLEAQRHALALLLQEIGTRVRVPSFLPLVLDDRTAYAVHRGAGDSVALIPRVGARLSFTLTAAGQIAEVVADHNATAPALDSVLAAAIERAREEGALALYDLGEALFQGRESARLAVAITWAPDSTDIRRPLTRMKLPRFLGTRPAYRDENRAPSYPGRAERAGESGDVVLEFDVDAAGGVDATSVSVLGDPPGTLRDATVSAVHRWRFIPARIGDCPVRTRVRQAFRYAVVP